MIKEIILSYQHLKPTFDKGMTNHLNMASYALYAMKASLEQIREFGDFYITTRGLETVTFPMITIDNKSWSRYLGTKQHYLAYVKFYEKKIDEIGKDNVLFQFVPQLLKGEAGDAFHGLIRLAYAVKLDEDIEIARALAYLSDCYLPFDTSIISNPKQPPVLTISTMSKDDYLRIKAYKGNLISLRMKESYNDQHLNKLLYFLPDKYLTHNSIKSLALEMYRLTKNFTMLHGVTSTHALGILEPFMTNPSNVYQYHWINLLLAYQSTGGISFKETTNKPCEESWSSIFEATVQSKDAHDIKLVYSLYEDWHDTLNDQLARSLAIEKLNRSND